ncbi:MAG: hypothetical protein AB8B69_00845 [Chitinophagales bacterium]
MTNEELQILEQNWTQLQEELAENFGQKPDLQSLLFLIGIQELGQLHRKFSKEQKQDLMHIAVCHLMSLKGYFELTHRDEQGWPHYKALRPPPEQDKGVEQQELLLKQLVLRYFEINNQTI